MNSIHIGRVFGINIRVHVLFLMMILFWGVGYGPAAALYLGMLVGLVLLHELGHSLVAQRLGIQVLDITFWPLGGMARMSHVPEDTRIETLIAIAGPAVNLALAALATPLAMLSGPIAAVAKPFILMNLGLGLLNLIPAFPMDGGRILRAYLGRDGNWLAGTETAARVGRFVALAMGLLGLFSRPMILVLPLIAVFVWWAGLREVWSVRLRHGFGPVMGDLFGEGAQPGSPGAGAQGPFDQDPFEMFRRAAGGAGPREAEPEMDRRGTGSRGGFTDADIERMERIRGPLGRPE